MEQDHGFIKVALNLAIFKLIQIIPWDRYSLILTFINNGVLIYLEKVFGHSFRKLITNLEVLN